MKTNKSLSNKLRSNTQINHKEVENLPYLNRYKSNNLLLEDHYFHLKEIHSIYMQLLVCLLQIKLSDKDPESTIFFIKELITSTHAINQDINTLESVINLNKLSKCDVKLKNCTSTLEYKNHLASLKNPEEVLAHCCVRWFGDSFGGQKIKKKVLSIYNSQVNNNLNLSTKKIKSDLNLPIQFYNNSIPASTLIKNLNTLGQSTLFTEQKEKNFLKEANLAFVYHKNIFQELEAKRQKSIQDRSNKTYAQIATITGVILLGTAIGYGCYKNM